MREPWPRWWPSPAISSPELAGACAELAGQSRLLADGGALPAPTELAAAVADARERVTSLAAVVATEPRMRPASVTVDRLADALALVSAP